MNAETWRLRICLTALALVAVACSDASTTPRHASLTIVSGNRQTAEVGASLTQPLVVLLRDERGGPVDANMVRLIREGLVIDSATTDAAGRASLRWTLANKAEVQQVIARSRTSGETVEAAFSATALPGPVAAIRLSSATTVAAPATALDTAVALVSDRFGNAVPLARVVWSVESGGGSVRVISDQTDARGMARAVFTLGTEPGGNELTVRSGAVVDRLLATGAVGLAARAVTVGATHACAIDPGGVAYCWGANQFGQLGIGTVDELKRARPVRVAGELRFTAISAGNFHTCGLTSDGTAYCWGENSWGQLGSVPADRMPAPVIGVERYVRIAAGGQHTCGLTTTGGITCWGDGAVGQHGDGRDRSSAESYYTARRPFPSPVRSTRKFVDVASSAYASCAVTDTGETWCWGSNGYLELGVSVAGVCRMPADPYYYPQEHDWPCSTAPVRVSVPGTMSSVSSAVFSMCGIADVDRIVCWSSGLARPTQIPEARATRVWTLGQYVCGLTSTGVGCWQIVDAPAVSFPRVRPYDADIELVDLAASAQTFCGLSTTAPALVYCWGTNESGQVGDGTLDTRPQPAMVRLPR